VTVTVKKKGLGWLALVGYVGFALVVFVCALVLIFPIERVAQQAATMASAQLGWKISLDGTRLALPFGVHADWVGAEPPIGSGVRVTDVNVSVDPRRLKGGVVSLDHQINVYDGQFDGHLEVTGPKTEPGYEWKGSLIGGRLSRLPMPPPGMAPEAWADGVALSGDVSADGAVGWRGNQPLRGNGELSVKVDTLVVDLAKSPLGALALPIGQVDGHFKWKRGRIDVIDLNVVGDVVQARGSGRIIVGSTPGNTRIDLRLKGELGSAFPMADVVKSLLKTKGKPVTISLKGTMAAPVLYINGKTLDRLMLGR